MTLKKRVLLSFLLACSLGTAAACSDDPKKPAEEEPDSEDEDEDDAPEDDEDETGSLMDAGIRATDAGKKDAGDAGDGGKKADAGARNSGVRGIDSGVDPVDDGNNAPTPAPAGPEGDKGVVAEAGDGKATVTYPSGRKIYLDEDCPDFDTASVKLKGCCVDSSTCGVTGYLQMAASFKYECRSYADVATMFMLAPIQGASFPSPDQTKKCSWGP